MRQKPLTLDPIDLKILKALQYDGRMPLAKLAEIAGLSPSPCLRRVRILEAAGIIATSPYWISARSSADSIKRQNLAVPVFSPTGARDVTLRRIF